MLPEDPKALVREGYNQISRNYRGDDFDFAASGYSPSLADLEAHLKPGSRILDLGCGNGVPVARHLASAHEVTGLDISEVQIGRAEVLVPHARFLCADMMAEEFPNASFDAIVSFFAIIHVPVVEQYLLFRRLAAWLTSGGYLLVSVGLEAWTGTKDDWHGGRMYWSHADAATYRTWLDGLGLSVFSERFLPEGAGGHPVLLAQKY